MIFDLINFSKLRRALLYTALMIFCLFLQNTVFSHISLFGVRPMFVPCFIVAVAVFSGAAWGGAFGLAAGILLDAQLVESVVLFTIALPILGFLAGVFMEIYLNKRFFSFFCVCGAVLVICALLQSMNLLFFPHTGELASIIAAQTSGGSPLIRSVDRGRILLVAALQVIWSLPFTIIFFYPCRRISRYGDKKR